MFGNLMNKLARGIAPLAFGVLLAGASLSLAGCGPKQDASTQASDGSAMPLAARVDRLDGEVGIARQDDAPAANQNGNQNAAIPDVGQTQPSAEWAKAGVNAPVSVGSRVYVKQGSHAAIAFSGRNYARLNSNTSLDVLSLSQRRTQLALREGSGVFDVGALAQGELFEVATPGGAVDFDQPGLYQVGIGDDGATLLTVLAGDAHVVGIGGSGRCARGQVLTYGGSGEDAYLADVDPGVSGGIVDDYYSYRYPKTYDGRYRDYKRYQDDPYYYDPYRRSVSYQYVPDDSEVAGLDDLDDNGDWQDVPGHGHCWRPRVASGWAPYRDGSWYNDQPLGLTWVSNERWGWAPYHYGRWASINQSWFWEPGETVNRPFYAPALVAFVPFPQEDRVGWVPLGPGDPYVSRYYDRNYQPQYIGSTTYITKNVNVTNIVNYNVPGAVTVVRTTEFSRGVTPGSAGFADAGMLARTRPVTDPYAVPRLREIAPAIQAGRPAFQAPVAVQQAMGRPVVISQNPIGPGGVTNAGKAVNVQAIPEAQTKRELRLNKSAQTVTAVQPNGLPVGPRAVVGQQANQQAQPGAAQQPQQPQTKAERKAAAQQQAQQGQQQAAAQQQQQQQTKQQQKAERKAAQQQGQSQPAAVGQQAQQQTKRQQQKAERKAAQQQGQPQPAAAQQQQQQQTKRQQQKAERKAAQPQGQPQPAAQQQQQQKAERKAARQQQAQQPPQPAAQQQQQQKAERKAARQQQAQPPQQPAAPSPSKAERKAEKNKNNNASSN